MPPSHLLNQSSALAHAPFVDSQIRNMLAARAITPVAFVPHCVNPLGVVPKQGSAKLRLVLNMRIAFYARLSSGSNHLQTYATSSNRTIMLCRSI